jgi:alkanesulfonate monooxygenase SsuD/methylene tetrahydromethanopterin reductase-like flavin-dependent oxidoreductase (luciferase family)
MRYAELLDAQGYDHLKVGDHTLSSDPSTPYPNSQVVLAAVGARTKRAKLSTAVTDPFRRHPVEIAHWVATLDQFTGGRAMLGIGAGEEMNITPYGIEWEKPWTRLKEAVEVIKLLWAATPASPADYAGEIFSLKGAYLQTRPLQKPGPGIYIGAIGKRNRELAGQSADGWFPMATETPGTLSRKLLDVRNGASRSGRSLERFDVQVTIYTDISEDPDRAYRSVEGAAKGALVWERSMLKERTGLDVPEELSVQRIDVTDREVMKRMSEFMALIPRSLVEEVTATGTVDACISRLERLLGAGATSVTICNLGQDQEKVYERYSKEIFPYLRENRGLGR